MTVTETRTLKKQDPLLLERLETCLCIFSTMKLIEMDKKYSRLSLVIVTVLQIIKKEIFSTRERKGER